MKPRISSFPSGRRKQLGKDAVSLADAAGLTLDDWQKYVLERSLWEQRPGWWSAFEVGVNVARQNGKGGIIEARILAELYLVKSPMTIYSAHNFDTSLEHFRRLEFLVEESDILSREVKGRKGARQYGITFGHGKEGIELVGDRRLRFRTRTKGGGRGFTCDLLILDEAMFIPEFTHGALLPTLSARPNPQVWYLGSAVDQLVHEHGVVFARVRERGLRGDPQLAYFEWSVEGDDPSSVPSETLEDPAAWAQANPAMGIRISRGYIENEHRSMDPRTFAVEREGIGDYPRTDHVASNPISIEAWDALLDEGSVLQKPPCFAIDVSPDRRTSIAAAGLNQHGQLHVEIADERKGTNWVPERVADLVSAHRPAAVVLDGYGPAASLVAALENMDVDVTTVTAGEHAQACSRLVDMVEAQEVRHLGSPLIDGALRGAQTRPLGDSWAWSRRNSSINIAPLVAATLALSAAVNTHADEGPMIVLPREPVS